MKRLAIILLICFSFAEIDYKKAYQSQVDVNYKIDQKLEKCNKATQTLKEKNIRLTAQKTSLENESKATYLIRVPFTKIGITNQHAQGAVVGFIVCLVII